jgi:hypothetical protein
MQREKQTTSGDRPASKHKSILYPNAAHESGKVRLKTLEFVRAAMLQRPTEKEALEIDSRKLIIPRARLRLCRDPYLFCTNCTSTVETQLNVPSAKKVMKSILLPVPQPRNPSVSH